MPNFEGLEQADIEKIQNLNLRGAKTDLNASILHHDTELNRLSTALAHIPPSKTAKLTLYNQTSGRSKAIQNAYSRHMDRFIEDSGILGLKLTSRNPNETEEMRSELTSYVNGISLLLSKINLIRTLREQVLALKLEMSIINKAQLSLRRIGRTAYRNEDVIRRLKRQDTCRTLSNDSNGLTLRLGSEYIVNKHWDLETAWKKR
ncbi:hypothetical protein BDV96DRAFT_607228 [Lophiotrema nucula]|uniref:Uncharacterized protein n=1 Tax=Lophiotrema nucula TaxID=690887 RepID=A0A6A5YII6_9PLEO|nr:hypothetical protein BDV96DRAFT_607228 [Lophiotrema nucula]